ncbi:MAG TPA: hypothetical protein VHD85_22290 [Terracidiphilus sp.]|nr:hypothetical protein [Terracidiphilus sp.]
MICRRICTGLLAAASLAALAGCHSYHIDTTIQNRSGGAVKLLEVDYPNASFGTDAIASGADFHYRFQIQGSGPIKIQYTQADGKTASATGPALDQGQEGRLQILLLPNAKVEFQPAFKSKP